MQQKNCKVCGNCSSQVAWVKAKGLEKGNKCLACAAAYLREYRATSNGLSARRASARKHAAHSRATIDGRNAHNIASNKSIAERYKNDKFFKFKTDLRSRITKAFSDEGYSCSSVTATVLGASFEDVLAHLTLPLGVDEIPEGYQIDHIIPLAVGYDEKSIALLNHFTNLQLLTEKENKQKSDTLQCTGVRARDLTLAERKAIIENLITELNRKTI